MEQSPAMARWMQRGVTFLLPETPNAVRIRYSGGTETRWGDKTGETATETDIYLVVGNRPFIRRADEHGGVQTGDLRFTAKPTDSSDIVDGDIVEYPKDSGKQYRCRDVTAVPIGDEDEALFDGILELLKGDK